MTQNSDFSPEQVDIIESIRETDGIPGVAAAIVKNGEIIAADGFGYRNRDAALPMTAHTVSPLCSLTKSFTGVAVMQLVDSGKLWLDEPVASYLPNFRVADIEASRKITPRILLCHKSGMGRTGHQSRMFTEPRPYKDRGELVSQLAEVALQTPPNATFSYCNEGYVTLGHLVEVISDIPLEDYFQTHIFDRVGMQRTYPGFSQWRAATDRAHGYRKKAEVYEETELPEDYNIYLSTGAICSTAYDYANYLIATMDYVNSPLLSAGALDAMQTLSVADGDTGWGYGFGWEIAWNAGRKIVSHGGGLPGIATNVSMVPVEQLGVVVLTNLAGAKARWIAEQLARTVLGVPLLRATLDTPLSLQTRYPTPETEALAQYIGTYTCTYPGSEEEWIAVKTDAGELTFHYPDEQEPMSFIAVAPDLFMDCRWGISVYFVRDAKGKVNKLQRGGVQFQRRE